MYVSVILCKVLSYLSLKKNTCTCSATISKRNIVSNLLSYLPVLCSLLTICKIA